MGWDLQKTCVANKDCVVHGGDLKQTEVGVPDGDVQLSVCCSKCFEGSVVGG